MRRRCLLRATHIEDELQDPCRPADTQLNLSVVLSEMGAHQTPHTWCTPTPCTFHYM